MGAFRWVVWLVLVGSCGAAGCPEVVSSDSDASRFGIVAGVAVAAWFWWWFLSRHTQERGRSSHEVEEHRAEAHHDERADERAKRAAAARRRWGNRADE